MTEVGDMIELKNQTVEVVECEECDHLMVNIDADEIQPGDLATLKKAGVRLSNPETEEEICLNCEIPRRPSFMQKVSTWFDSSDDDDSSFFHSTPSSPSIFGGSSIGGGFGGFGGGSFSGGGASRSF